MRMSRAHKDAGKTPTSLSARVDLMRRAKALKLNLSEVFEASLETAIRDAEQRAWLSENSEAIDSYNAAVAAWHARGRADGEAQGLRPGAHGNVARYFTLFRFSNARTISWSPLCASSP